MLLVVLLELLLAFAFPADQDHAVRASPFDAIRWTGEDLPEVRIGEEWYAPVAIDGVAVAGVLAKCDARWPGLRHKRFAEDLVEALALCGWEGDLAVDLDLVRLADGEAVRLEGVAMTRAKRDALRDAAGAQRRWGAASVPRADALRDVEVFEVGLRERFAYLSLRPVDLAAELERVRAGVEDPADVRALAAALHRVLMRFGDGHAAVQAPVPGGESDDRYLPFLLVEAAEGVVAVAPDRSALVDPKRPVVRAIDGRPLEDWIAAVTPDVAAGSPQLVRHRALRDLRAIDAARRALGLTPGAPLKVTFTDAGGRREDVRALELAADWPIHGDWPRTETRELQGGFGYLRLADMDDDVAPLRAAMKGFEDTRGLVVDVRGNGGGSRALLEALAGYLIGPDDPALVANVAAYRASGAFPEDHLEARLMRRASWPGWSERRRAAIEAFAPGFAPEWTPPEAFSEWHYLVLDRTGHPEEYPYGAPVVVLCDAGCFSATDVFLGALELLPQVTLVGTASSGGSARVQGFALPATGIKVRCASMVSYRPDGRLYDGRGVEVDVEVRPAAGDLVHGGGDAQLEAALKVLRRR